MPVNFSQEQLQKTAGEAKPEVKENQPLMDKINNALLKLSKVPSKEKLFFVQHLGVMLKAGISLSIAIKTLSNQTEHKYFKVILADIASRVEKGSSFAESLENHKKTFGELFVNMIDAGELSGKLEEVLVQIFLQMKKDHKLMSKVKGALTYPAVILLVMFGIGIFMLVFVVPKITVMFGEMNVELPLPTKILINTSNAIANNGIISAIIFIFLVSSLLNSQKRIKAS